VIKLIFYFLPFLSLFLPSIWVNYVLKKNNKILPDMPFTGKELGLKLLKENKLDNVLIESIQPS
jgi:Zn-dependent membrane protease YugP